MGGIGSGAYERERAKTAVGECYVIQVDEIARDRDLHRGRVAECLWLDQFGRVLFRVQFSVGWGELPGPRVRLSYQPQWCGHGDSVEITMQIRLLRTIPNYGGSRWWFACPLVFDGVACQRRASRLYLPPGCRWFGCRHCYELIYRSEPDPFERAERMLKVLKKRHERLVAKHSR